MYSVGNVPVVRWKVAVRERDSQRMRKQDPREAEGQSRMHPRCTRGRMGSWGPCRYALPWSGGKLRDIPYDGFSFSHVRYEVRAPLKVGRGMGKSKKLLQEKENQPQGNESGC